jgi:Tfp pilus assembly protein PilF
MKSIPFPIIALALVAAGCQTPPFQSAAAKRAAQQAGEGSWADKNPLESDRHAAKKDSGKPLDFLRNTSRRERERAVAENLAQAHRAYSSQRLTEAAAFYEKVLKDDPGNPEAHHKLANIADGKEDFQAADRHYAAAKRARPDDANLLNDMGYSRFLQRDFVGSERLLTEALTRQPGHKRALYNLGWLYGTQGDSRRAYELFLKAGSEDDARQMMARLERTGSSPDPRSLARGSQDRNVQSSIYAPAPNGSRDEARGRLQHTGYERRSVGGPGQNTLDHMGQGRQVPQTAQDRNLRDVTPWNERDRYGDSNTRYAGEFDRNPDSAGSVRLGSDARIHPNDRYRDTDNNAGRDGNIVITPRGREQSGGNRFDGRADDRALDQFGPRDVAREEYSPRSRDSYDDRRDSFPRGSGDRDPLLMTPDRRSGGTSGDRAPADPRYGDSRYGDAIRPASSTDFGSTDYGRNDDRRSTERFQNARYETYSPAEASNRGTLDPSAREALRMGHNAGADAPFSMPPTGDDRGRRSDSERDSLSPGPQRSNDNGFAVLPEPPDRNRNRDLDRNQDMDRNRDLDRYRDVGQDRSRDQLRDELPQRPATGTPSPRSQRNEYFGRSGNSRDPRDVEMTIQPRDRGGYDRSGSEGAGYDRR